MKASYQVDLNAYLRQNRQDPRYRIKKFFWSTGGFLVVCAFILLFLYAVTPRPTGTAQPTAPARRPVILFNQDAQQVMVFTNTDALQLLFDVIRNPSGASQAQLKAAEVEGKVFKVASGTRANVLAEVPVPNVPGVSLLRIRIRNGPHQTEDGICFSEATQPDLRPD